jgi:MFS family permease
MDNENKGNGEKDNGYKNNEKTTNIAKKIEQQNFSVMTKKEIIIIYIINLIIFVIVNYFFYLYIKLPSNNFFYISIVLTYIIPTLILLYSLVYEYYYQATKTPEESLKEFKKEDLKEKKSSVATIVFGLALFLIALKRKHIGSIIPYLISAVVFGLSIPEILDNLIIDHDNYKRTIYINNLQSSFVSLSNGFLFMGLFLTIYYFTKHSEIKFYSLYNKK